MDDLIFTGCSKYINEIFLPKIQDRFDTSVSKIEKFGGKFNFLRRKYKLGRAMDPTRELYTSNRY